MTVDIDAIKRANPLESVVERMTGQRIVKHKIKAPWRQDDTPSVHIYDDGKWHDFGTGMHGDVLDFVGYCIHGVSYRPEVHFTEVVDLLGGIDIAPLPAVTNKPKPPKPQLMLSMTDVQTWHDTMPTKRRWYWQQRGLTDKTIDRFMLGWDDRRQSYTIPATYRNILFAVKFRNTPERISQAQDAYEKEYNRLRALHPEWTDEQVKNECPSIPPKYFGVTGQRSGIFNADCLWTAHDVIVCEGEIDAMLITQAGYNACTSTAGAVTWKPEWANLFAGVQRIYICYDNDAAGREGALKVRSTLARGRIVTYPDGVKDAGELFTHKWAAEWLYNNVE